MAVITIRQGIDLPNGTVAPRVGIIQFSRREAYVRADGGVDWIITPQVMPVETSAAPTLVTLADGYWNIREWWRGGRTFLVLVAGDANYEDLPIIDPATLDPVAVPEAAWQIALDALQAQVDGIGLGDLGREFVQATPLATWIFTVPTGINRRPGVTIYDNAGNEVEADVVATTTTVTVTFPEPTPGSLVLN